VKKKPADPEPPEPSPDGPPPQTAGDVMQAKLDSTLRASQDEVAKAAMAAGLAGPESLLGVTDSTLADLAKPLHGVTDSATADMAKAMAGVPDSTLAEIVQSLKGVTDSPWAAGFDALKLADLKDALAGSNERWAGLIGQATETAKMAHEWAQPAFTVPESPLEAYLWENPPELEPIAVRPDPLPGMSAELGRVSGLVAVMADNVVVMAGLGQRAEEALLRLEVEAGQTRVETERLRGALEKGQRSSDRLAGVLIFLTIVIAGLTVALLLRGG
jgi:hypothetical protein